VTGYGYGIGTEYDYATIKYVPAVTVGLNCLTPIVVRGDRLRYEYTFTNNTAQIRTFQYWAKAKLPNGNWYKNYVVPPTPVNLNPDESKTYTVRHTVPQKAPLGTYEYWGYVGSDTTSVWDDDMFYFTVIPFSTGTVGAIHELPLQMPSTTGGERISLEEQSESSLLFESNLWDDSMEVGRRE